MNRLLITTILLCCLALSARSQTNNQPATLQTLIAAGVKTNAVEEIKAVLKAHPELVFARYPNCRTFLFYAALGGNTNVLEAMLSCKAEVNVRDTNGTTPLHLAAAWGNNHAVALLLANKAEVNARNNKDETPLRLALRHRSSPAVDVADLIKESQSVTNYRGPDGSIIMRSRRDETIKILFQHGAHE